MNLKLAPIVSKLKNSWPYIGALNVAFFQYVIENLIPTGHELKTTGKLFGVGLTLLGISIVGVTLIVYQLILWRKETFRFIFRNILGVICIFFINWYYFVQAYFYVATAKNIPWAEEWGLMAFVFAAFALLGLLVQAFIYVISFGVFIRKRRID